MRARAAQIAAMVLFCLGGMTSASANPALLFEISTGKVLYSEDVDDVWYPASLTKLTTAYLAFQAIKDGKLHLDDKIPCSLVATLQPPSKAGLKVGDAVVLLDRLQGGREALRKQGIHLLALLSLDQLMNYLRYTGKIANDDYKRSMAFIEAHRHLEE